MRISRTRAWVWSVVTLSTVALCRAQEPVPAPIAPPLSVPETNAPAVTAATNDHVAATHPAPATNAPPAVHSTNAPVHTVPTSALTPSVGTTGPVVGVEAPMETGSWMVGTRLTQFDLLDDKRGTPFHDSFMGSITMLNAEQDDVPNKVFVQYRLFQWPCWIGVSYDHVRASADDDGGSDGSVDLAGPLPYVQGRWENSTRLVPYLEAGMAFYSVTFDEDPNWYAGGRRTVEIDSSVTGLEVAGGLAIRVYKGLSLDFYAQYMKVDDITGEYYILGNRGGDVIFTMSHVTYGIGAQYQF